MADLVQVGCRRAVLQSLHLICGQEFHHAVWAAAKSPLAAHIGMPLLSSPSDFEAVLGWVAARLAEDPREALVLVGHGTAHPSWMTYEVLARRLKERFEHRVALGLVSKGASPDRLAQTLGNAGVRRLVLRPFMLVAGAHYHRDIAAEDTDSWKTVLETAGFEVSAEPEGIGTEPAIMDLYIRHIRAAMAAHPMDLN
jgi:sirohydrochlorin cobaltochelatase